jgi:hypothetical protein
MLLTAAEWHRAAIIAAFVDNPDTANEFAALGITGLKTKETVMLYATRWIETHGSRPEPGSEVILPTLEWKGTRTGTDGLNSAKGARSTLEKMIDKHGPKAVAEMLTELAPEEAGEAVGADRKALYAANELAYALGSHRAPRPERDGTAEMSDEGVASIHYIEAGGHAARSRQLLLAAVRSHGTARDIMELRDNEKGLLRTRMELRRILDLWDAIAAGAPADLSEFDSEVSE